MSTSNSKTKQNIIKEYAINKTDTGSIELQIALLTHKIKHLITHLKNNKKDNATRNGLLAMVGKRKKFLGYLSRKKPDIHQSLTKKLKIKH
ncbi:30S ribosomal protein S15 [Candidatus Marinamargulisbacteria bacterium SCGC AG-333-B06]|nr:30S ribosomal protein S15 [Candidatus Marinamargulisbacteria bacterium SCGC AG-333-B06]